MPTTTSEKLTKTPARRPSLTRVPTTFRGVRVPEPEMHGSTRLAVEYLRVSKDERGRQRSITDQHDDNVCNSDRLSWQITRTYCDNDISASTFGDKIRGDFEELMDDIERGALDGQLLILWEPSRASRRVVEWANLIDLMAVHGMTIYVTSGHKELDPRDPHDRRRMHEDATDAEYESGKTSMRVRRAVRANAVAGRPHAHCPYGYERVYDGKTRELIEQREHLAEAEIVRRIFKEIAAGTSFRQIAKALNDEGVPAPRGGQWHLASLSAMVRRPLYIGKRTHVEGRGGEQQVTDGLWPALVDEALFYAVQAVVSEPSRRYSRPGALKHWMSGLVLCGVCGGRMRVVLKKLDAKQLRRTDMYRCAALGQCVSIRKDTTEVAAEELLIDHLADPEVRERILSGGQDDADMLRARADVARIQELLHATRLGVTIPEGREGHVSIATLGVVEPQLLAQIAAAEAKLKEVALPPQLRNLMDGPVEEMRARWEALPAAAKRDAARAVFRLRVSRRERGQWLPTHRLAVEWII